MRPLLTILVCGFLLGGCSSKQSIKPVRNEIVEQQEEIIAKFAELPDAPFGTRLEHVAVASDNHDQLQIFYTTIMTPQDLIAFYEQQMERLGWEFYAQSMTQDFLLHYSKPSQLCSFLIKDGYLAIYIGNKKSA